MAKSKPRNKRPLPIGDAQTVYRVSNSIARGSTNNRLFAPTSEDLSRAMGPTGSPQERKLRPVKMRGEQDAKTAPDRGKPKPPTPKKPKKPSIYPKPKPPQNKDKNKNPLSLKPSVKSPNGVWTILGTK